MTQRTVKNPFPRLLLPALAGLTLAAFVLWLQHKPRNETPAAPAQHLVLVVLDTVGAQWMSLYNERLDTTPFLQGLSQFAVVFDQARAPGPWTVPSHASLFTGLWPAEHKAQWGRFVLNDSHLTLAEVLRAEGFHTVGLSSNSFVASNTGFSQGFVAFGNIKAPAHERSNQLLESLDEVRAPGRRHFLFLNFMDAHLPYNTAPFGDQYGVEQFGGPVRESPVKWAITAGARPFTPEEKEAHQRAYQAAIRNLDALMARLMRWLEEQGMLSHSVVVITSDHGDGMGLHQEIGHSASTWEEQLHVPLMVFWPRSELANRRIERKVSLTQVPGTALDLLGIDRPPGWERQPSLLEDSGQRVSADYRSYFSKGERALNRQIGEQYPELAARTRHTHVLYCDEHKLMVRPEETARLYNLREDPTEQQPIVDEDDPRTAACLYDYWDLLEAGRFTPFDEEAARDRKELDEAFLEELRSLGYIQ